MGCCYCLTSEKELNLTGQENSDRIVEHVQKSTELNAGLEKFTDKGAMSTRPYDCKSLTGSPLDFPVYIMKLPDNSSEISVNSWKKEFSP
ncbi:hypothetical protein SteCoe_25741 [Stentor coeruleus]|uniref:Uncharacterized protein n=1 Tax=Stentor coeruleus TaxID=5963 RepID=A0A1R2BER0_9CILI|nr:hypothetical protein SteCoe_25741 [Stentor coeruleus]